jgi:hypothetical protein
MSIKDKPKKKVEPTFTREELIAAAESFGVMPEVMAGALFGIECATKAEAEKKIKEFLQKGVK